MNLLTGKGRVISQGPGTPSVGLKIDPRGRIFVSGGPAGNARVVDRKGGPCWPATGSPRRRRSSTTSCSPGAGCGSPTPCGPASTGCRSAATASCPRGRRSIRLPLKGQWHQVANNFNANGIERTPDRAALLVIQTATGFLFRVNPRTGIARRVDLGSTVLKNGDGMLRDRRTLYVVQNQLKKIAVLRLNEKGTKGRLVASISSTDFDVPTTVARRGGSLYLPNARFGNTDPEPKPYWVTRVRR